MQLTPFKKRQPRLLFLWLFFLASFIVSGQGLVSPKWVSLQGNLKSLHDSSAIEFAHVYLRNTAIGTVSNSNGDFILNIPDSQHGAEVVVSMVGYNTETVSIDSGTSPKVIYLMPTVNVLQEVIITSSRVDSSEHILSEAIHFIKFNYPHERHQLEGFYRATSILDTSYTRLIESAILVQEVGYNKNTWEDESMTMVKNRVKIIELRKTDDFRDKDFLAKALTLIFGERNDLYQLLAANYVRLVGHKSNHVMSKNNLQELESEYLGKAQWDGKSVYSILLRNQSPMNFQWDEVNFFINKDDFAILRIELKRLANPNRKDIPKESLVEGKYFFKSEITYRKINNKYYPAFIRTVGNDYGASHTVKVGDKVLKQYSEQIFLLTNIFDNNFSKLRNRDKEERDTDIYKIDRPYNENFWKTYNTILLNPLKRRPVEMEQKRSLEDQFRDTRKNGN